MTGRRPPASHGVATVNYDLTALTGEAAAGLARFAAGYPEYLRHWEAAITDATRTRDAAVLPGDPGTR